MLTGDTYTRAVPGEPGHQFTFRHLTALEMDEADQSGSVRLGKELEALPSSLVGQVMDRGDEEVKDAKARRTQQFRGFDPNVLVKYGIVDWTYKDKDGTPVPCNPESIARLVWRTRNWAAQVIFDEDVREPGESNGSGMRSAGAESPEPSSPPTASSGPE
jgi:hypothetical protein